MSSLMESQSEEEKTVGVSSTSRMNNIVNSTI